MERNQTLEQIFRMHMSFNRSYTIWCYLYFWSEQIVAFISARYRKMHFGCQSCFTSTFLLRKKGVWPCCNWIVCGIFWAAKCNIAKGQNWKFPLRCKKRQGCVCNILKENVFPYTQVGAEEGKSSYISECCHVPDPQTEGEIPVVESRLWSQVVAGPQENASGYMPR